MTPEQIAQKVAQSKAAGGGNWIKQGKGVLICKGLISGTKPEFYQGDTFVAELYVESSESFPGALAIKNNVMSTEPEYANVPGSTVSFLQQMERFPETAFGQAKGFLLNLLDESDESLAVQAAETAKRLTAEGRLPPGGWGIEHEFAQIYVGVTDRKLNRCRGLRIRYETYVKPKQKKPLELMVLIRWTPIKGQTAESVAQARAMLDG